MTKSLEKRILIFSFIVLFLTILANTGMDIYGFRKDYVNALVMRSQSLGNTMKSSIEKILGLGIDFTAMSGLNEKCQDLVNTNPEIAYCSITDLEGIILSINDSRFRSLHFDTHTKDSTSAKLVQNVHILGDKERFFNTVTPVKTPDGRIAALIHVGFRSDLVSDKVNAMVLRSLLILAVFFALSFSLVAMFIKRSVIQPISSLLSGLQKISSGSLDTRIPEISTFEINELAKNINLMTESLKIRDEEIQSSYKELAGTHQKLQSSYQQLEALSQELEKSEELYKSLMENSNDAIVVFDATERVKVVNKMAESFFGYSAQELITLPLTKLLLLLNIENIPKLHKSFQEAANGKQINDEINFIRKDGESVIGKIYASCIPGGDDQLVQVIFRDVTKEMITLSNLSKSAADLVRLNKMKDSFLGLASHELKTPLTVIMGYAELIVTDMSDKTDPAVMEMVQNIANAAVRLDSIVKDMVDVSMIDEKRLRLKQEEVNVNRLAEAAVKELRLFFTMRQQEVVLHLDETIPTIIGDSLRLMQLLSNILGNAIKFTQDGGRITVSTNAKYLLRGIHHPDGEAEIKDHCREQHLYVEIVVADNGIGIDRDDQVRIFDKFYEAGNIEEHSSGKVAFKAKGAGLGLAIAKGIVQMHGGDIWVDSPGYHPDQCPGSAFHILLPVKPFSVETNLDYMNILH